LRPDIRALFVFSKKQNEIFAAKDEIRVTEEKIVMRIAVHGSATSPCNFRESFFKASLKVRGLNISKHTERNNINHA